MKNEEKQKMRQKMSLRRLLCAEIPLSHAYEPVSPKEVAFYGDVKEVGYKAVKYAIENPNHTVYISTPEVARALCLDIPLPSRLGVTIDSHFEEETDPAPQIEGRDLPYALPYTFQLKNNSKWYGILIAESQKNGGI